MESRKPAGFYMRVLHRYIGFFLAGIMAVYALSGVVLIFRTTDYFKKQHHIERTLSPGLSADALGKELKMRDLKFKSTEGDIQTFEQGTYNSKSGQVSYNSKELPFVLEKLTHLHKASTKDPLYYFNVFFALSLLFFVLSSFWMFRPKTKTFKKGLYYSIAGFVLMLILLYV